MNSGLTKSLLVAALQLLIVGTLFAKFAHDRATCPRAWVRTGYYDPDLPIRGRYASLQIQIDAPGVFQEKPLVEQRQGPSVPQKIEIGPQRPHYVPVWEYARVRLEVRDTRLVAVADAKSNISARYWRNEEGVATIVLQDPVDFYVPEHAGNLPTWSWPRQARTDWWVEVTVPKKGPPRPLRIGIRQNDGKIVPLPAS
ncbi:MAG TPA: hypothetical protein VG498_12685 [Terriglobales bacterium]|nr:hypothetical protein [Terriglobales bacterium]